jgi:hypothetical protein
MAKIVVEIESNEYNTQGLMLLMRSIFTPSYNAKKEITVKFVIPAKMTYYDIDRTKKLDELMKEISEHGGVNPVYKGTKIMQIEVIAASMDEVVQMLAANLLLYLEKDKKE